MGGFFSMTRYSQLRDRAAGFVSELSPSGPVLVLATRRAPAEEAARIACESALVGVQRLGLRELVLWLASDEMNRRELVPVGRIVREALAARVAANVELSY